MDSTLGGWITNQTTAPFYARRQFSIEKEIRSVTVRICGLGQFLLSVNGRKVGNHELDPGWTDYHKIIQYITFDITSYLHVGENVLGAEVGNGWFWKDDTHYTFHFPGFMPPNPNPYVPFGRWLVLALELTLSYQDGTCEQIHADERFLVKEHPTVMSNVYGSETMDGRLVQKGWDTVDFSAAGWKPARLAEENDLPRGTLVPQLQPPVQVLHTYDAICLGEWHDASGCSCTIYDFGQNMSGILEFEAYGKSGDKIWIYPAEKLTADGNVDQMAKGWTKVDSCITYIIGEDDQWEPFRMRFTYFAGRYIGVETSCVKAPASKPGSAERDSAECASTDRICVRGLKAHAISSAHETHGSFSCDDSRYEQIYALVEKAVEANLLSVHTDCPTIERFAWQEPNHLMAPSIFYMKNGRELWKKFFLDMRTAQHTVEDYFLDFAGNKFYPGEGLIPSQCPCYMPNVLPVPGMGSFYDIIPWGSSIILGTYWHYLFYGDISVVEENYAAGRRYLEYLKTKLTKDGFICHGLGDWGNPVNELARENVETAFFYADITVLAQFAHLLGKMEEEEELTAYAGQIRDNYNKKLLVRHPEEGFWCYRIWEHTESVCMTQAAEALPLYWGMVPPEREADVVKVLRYTLERENALLSGEIGLPYIIQSARKYGMNDLISRFILRSEHPSYYAFVLDGETTLGEYWQTNPRSHCHDMMGHIVEWYYNGIAGIQPLTPGFGRVRICPYLPETMHRFHCTYQSAAGSIWVQVEEREEAIHLFIEIAEGMDCSVDVHQLEARGKQVCIEVEQWKGE